MNETDKIPDDIKIEINRIVDSYPSIDFSDSDVVSCLNKLTKYIISNYELKDRHFKLGDV